MARTFDEQFENTGSPGYDETSSGIGGNWSESVPGGATVDENYSTGSVTGAPADWDDECLYIDTAGNSAANTKNHLDSAVAAYWRVEFIIVEESLANGDTVEIVKIKDQVDYSSVVDFFIEQSGGTLYLSGSISGTSIASDYAVAIETRYRLEFWYSKGSGWATRVDGVAWDSGPAGEATDDNPGYIHLGSVDYAKDIIYAFDNVAIDDADWVGAESAGEEGSSVPIILSHQRRRRS